MGTGGFVMRIFGLLFGFLVIGSVDCSVPIAAATGPNRTFGVVRRNLMDEILTSVKILQENCQQWTSRTVVEETFMESLANRLSLTEAKLENSISKMKSTDGQRSLEDRLATVERLVENTFDRLARKMEELADTIRGLQTMAIINQNSTEEKIKRMSNFLANQNHVTRSPGPNLTSETVNELQAFWESKLINSEKMINRHVSLAKDEIKELIGEVKLNRWSNELTAGIDSVESIDLIGTVTQIKSEVTHRLDKLENQIKFANQEINFKLDSQLTILNNQSFGSFGCGAVRKEARRLGTSSTVQSTDDQIITTTSPSIDAKITSSNGTHDLTTASSNESLFVHGDHLVTRDRRCQITPNKTSMVNCESIPFQSTWRTCADIYRDKVTCDGVYLIMMEPRPSRVWCDMNDNGGGWMVILRRGNFDSKSIGLVSFNQNWFLYKYGFGDQRDEYWLGNEHIHRLTSTIPHQLQIDLESYDGQCISLDYGYFSVDSEEKAYRFMVSDARGPFAVIGESLLLYNNSAFNTRDRINDRNSLRCGHFHGGWWFNGFACYSIYLTGEYSGPDDYKGQLPGIHWQSWKPNKALKSIQMKIRPVKSGPS